MSIFKYTLPSGAEYIVETPAGYTQAQADLVFYGQVASGSLVGYTQGQQLSSASTRLAKFGLSRLDRGIAGVDVAAILAIIQNSPVVAVSPSLANIALQNPINSADFSQKSTPLGVTPVGSLTSSQTQAILAQITNLVDQPANTVSTTGVGEYAFSPNGLEQAGYLKPGTSNYPDYNCVVGTPEVWTGKNGVYSLASVLGDPATQGQIQTEIMQNGYNALTAAGTIQTAPTQPVSLAQGQVYTNTGLSTLSPVALIAGAAATTGTLNSLVKSAFAGAGNINNLLSNPVTNIGTLANGAVNEITQGITNLPGNIANAANNQAYQLVSGTVGQLTSGLNQVTSLASGITNGIAGTVGGLVTNASQFGSQVTAAWAKGSDLLNSSLGSGVSEITGGITSGLNSATSAINGITSTATSAISSLTETVSGTIGSATTALSGAVGDLTNMASTALGELSGQAQSLVASLGGSLDIFGKMGSFSIDFSLFSTDSLVSPTKVAAGYSNTVDRQTVDAAVTRILGNPKIPAPQFEFPSANSINLGADIQYAKNILNSITGTATNLINQATTTASNIQTAANRLIG